jgi:hypothetical protein
MEIYINLFRKLSFFDLELFERYFIFEIDNINVFESQLLKKIYKNECFATGFY